MSPTTRPLLSFGTLSSLIMKMVIFQPPPKISNQPSKEVGVWGWGVGVCAPTDQPRIWFFNACLDCAGSAHEFLALLQSR